MFLYGRHARRQGERIAAAAAQTVSATAAATPPAPAFDLALPATAAR
jgi:hypothetical protein